MPRRSVPLLCVLSLVAACAGGARGGPPPVPTSRDTDARSPALAHAIASWHEQDDLEPLRSWVRGHPEDPEVGVWREVVALHSYESHTAGEHADEAGMRTVAREYPETLAGQVAAIHLVGDRIEQLYAAMPGTVLTDFLDGGDAWARTADGDAIEGIDTAAIRERHTEPLRDALGRSLVADRCKAEMGYCTWWIARYPGDARTDAITAAASQTWYERGHPHWRGGRHARCALRCARDCRDRAAPLDDSCYAPCYSRC